MSSAGYHARPFFIRYLFTFFLSISLITACSPTEPAIEQDQATESPEITQSPIEEIPVNTQTINPTPTETPVPRIGFLLEQEDIAMIEYMSSLRPGVIDISPDGEIYAINIGDSNIFKLDDDGNSTIFFQMPQVPIGGFEMDSKGQVWFTTGAFQLYRLDADNQPELVVDSGINRMIHFDDHDNLYAAETGVDESSIQKITPEGDLSIIAQGLTINNFSVRGDGEIVYLNNSAEAHLLSPNGTSKLLASNLPPDGGIDFGPDGRVCLFYGNEIVSIDINTAASTTINTIVATDPGFILAEEKDIFLIGHPNYGIYRFNAVENSVELVYLSKGNTNALAVNEMGNVYVAYGDGLPNGQTTLYKVIGINELEAISSVPRSNPSGLAIDKNNVAYLGGQQPGKETIIFAIDLASGEYEEFARVGQNNNLSSISINPINGDVWWAVRNESAYYQTEDGSIQSVPVPGNPDQIHLQFDRDGNLYAVITQERDGAEPFTHKKAFYTFNEDGSWSEIADLSTSDPTIWWVVPAICQNGKHYIIQSLDAFSYGEHPRQKTFNAVLRIEEDNSVSLLGYYFSFDAYIAVCDSSNEILFSSGLGILRYIDN